MDVTQDQIINIVCKALELDRDKLLSDDIKRSREYESKYLPAKYITAYLIREKVKVIKETKRFGREKKTPTYKQIAKIFNRKCHKSIIYWEIDCRVMLREKNEKFKEKFDMVINLLDNNVNIA